MLRKTLHVSGFAFHFAYGKIPMPRMGDRVVAEMLMEHTMDKETFEALQRVRGSVNVIFLSDMVTVDGKNLEQNVIDLENWKIMQTKYDFPLECPTKADEQIWLEFWRSRCIKKLPTADTNETSD